METSGLTRRIRSATRPESTHIFLLRMASSAVCRTPSPMLVRLRAADKRKHETEIYCHRDCRIASHGRGIRAGSGGNGREEQVHGTGPEPSDPEVSCSPPASSAP